jgi:hypothetical protein
MQTRSVLHYPLHSAWLAADSLRRYLLRRKLSPRTDDEIPQHYILGHFWDNAPEQVVMYDVVVQD